jgi:hypothetical protein
MPNTPIQQTHPFHGLFLDHLNHFRKVARNREENDRRCEPDNCTPAKYVVQEPNAYDNLKRNIKNCAWWGVS